MFVAQSSGAILVSGNDLELYTPLEEIFARQGFDDGFFLGPLELDYMLKKRVWKVPMAAHSAHAARLYTLAGCVYL